VISITTDLGGTVVKCGIVRDGRVLAHVSIPAESTLGLARKLPEISDTLKGLLHALGLNAADCSQLGIAFPGLVNSTTNTVATTYGKWGDAPKLDLEHWAKDQFGLPLIIENDSRLALLGEWCWGAGVGCEDLVLITLGTGLGTAAMIEGRLLNGLHGQAGVLGGHLSGNLHGAVCTCGNIGCAEAEASTSVLPRCASGHPAFSESELAAQKCIDYRALFECAREGDGCSQDLLAVSIEVWAQMAINLIHAYDPERIICCGGVMASASDFLPRLTASIHSRAHTPWGKVEMRPGVLGPSAALLGVEALSRQRAPQVS
jgi:glucokinase